MKEYIQLLDDVYLNGVRRFNRTEVATFSIFGARLEIDLKKGFPLLTTKKVHFKSVVCELLWFLSGNTNTEWLKLNGVTIWDEWADKDGNLGRIYGAQWRHWRTSEGKHVDQISKVIENIKRDPYSRRLIVTAWNPAELNEMALPPCHCLFQFYVDEGHISCHVYQRSADIFLGVPFNIASYALLTHMVAQVTHLRVDRLIMSFGDVHLYDNHINQAEEQLNRELRPLPILILNPEIKNIFEFGQSDIILEDYNPHPSIYADIVA